MNEIKKLQSISSFYTTWVHDNTTLARHIENLLYLLPQGLPTGYNDDTTLSTELVYAAVGLLKFYHDTILTSDKTPLFHT